MKYLFSILLSLFAMTLQAQFVDIEWLSGDTVPPYYRHSYEVGENYRTYDYAFAMEYVETQPATSEEIARYRLAVDELTSDFTITSHMGVVRKQGLFDVSVFPFAMRDGKVVKLTSFKPVLTKTPRLNSHSRVARGTTEQRYVDSSLLASGRWVKIRVSKEGVYELTKSKLSSMGFSNPAKVRLYGYNVPMLREGDIELIPDDMQEIPLWRKSNGNVLFYSCGLTSWVRKNSTRNIDFTHTNNPYSNYVSYFVTDVGDGTPATFDVVDEISVSAVEATTFAERTIIEADEYSFLNAGRMFFEAYDFANGNRRNYTLDLPGIVDGKATVTVQFGAAGSTSSSLKVEVGDKSLGSMAFTALSPYIYGVLGSRNYTVTDIANDKLTLTLTHTRNSGVSGHLDYIRAAYERKLDLTGVDALPFTAVVNQDNAFKVSGATASTKVWRVTSPDNTYELKGTLADGVYTASAKKTDGRMSNDRYVALNVNAVYPQPEVVGVVANQNLHATPPVDLVIIVPANGLLTEQAQRLADAHTAREGMRCVVVAADKIYNEYSSGMPDATAYRRFLKMLYDRATTDADAPKNVLLFGDGIWDNRCITSGMRKFSQDDYLLCYESENSVSLTNSYVLEDYFAFLDDGEGGSPLRDKMDIGVGRIPVTSPFEASAVVDKLISYINNEEAGSWKNTICFLGDDGDNNLHMRDAENVLKSTEDLFPTYRYRRIYWDAYTLENTALGASFPAAYADINKQMDDGALIMNYTGHGAAYSLSHEKVLLRTDFERWSSPRLPLWITAACDVSPFDMNEPSIGESALLNKKGAAMGMLTTARTVYSTQNKVLNIAFMKTVLARHPNGKRITLGEALQLAKCKIVASGMEYRDSINKCHFLLLGDPAITLATPEYGIEIDEFDGHTADNSTSPMISAGSVVKVSGHVVKDDGTIADNFNGLVSPSVFDNLEKVICKNGAEAEVDSLMSYYERLRVIYSGTDSVHNGRFEFTFPVPLDINYSDKSGLLRLYAVNGDHTEEAHGDYDQFLVGGTSPALRNDTLGPQISLYLNSEEFQPGGKVNASPLLVATLMDEDGINTTGSGVGHDITLVVDNDPAMTYSLNDYYKQTPGDYVGGTVTYRLPSLSVGLHTLTFRAWDVLNNFSSVTVPFEVVGGLAPTLFDFTCTSPVTTTATFTIKTDRALSVMSAEVRVYDMTGREVARLGSSEESGSNVYTFTWNLAESNAYLQPGVYICRAVLIDADGGKSAAQVIKILKLK